MAKDLTSRKAVLKYRKIPAIMPLSFLRDDPDL
jgi:hypothetical protein